MEVNHTYNGDLRIIRMDPMIFNADGTRCGFKVYRVSDDPKVKSKAPQDYLKQLLTATAIPEESKKDVFGMVIVYPSPVPDAAAFNKVYTWKELDLMSDELPNPKLYRKTRSGGRIEIDNPFAIDSPLEDQIALYDLEQFKTVSSGDGRKVGNQTINFLDHYLRKVPTGLNPYMMRQEQ